VSREEGIMENSQNNSPTSAISSKAAKMRLSYDLHIHSCLSPCGNDDMLPSSIAGMAVVAGLDVIAVTDHNSCKNCPAVLKAALAYGIAAIPGMELTTAEEAHVLCLFENLEDALAFDEYVSSRLPPFPNNADIFGKQQIVNEEDEIIGEVPNLLIGATEISFGEVYPLVTRYNGIMIPAHIDKSSTSLLSNLGFIPPDSQFTCAEIKHVGFLERTVSQHEYLKKCRIIHNSDAHYLEQINEPVNFIEAASNNIADILRALGETFQEHE